MEIVEQKFRDIDFYPVPLQDGQHIFMGSPEVNLFGKPVCVYRQNAKILLMPTDRSPLEIPYATWQRRFRKVRGYDPTPYGKWKPRPYDLTVIPSLQAVEVAADNVVKVCTKIRSICDLMIEEYDCDRIVFFSWDWETNLKNHVKLKQVMNCFYVIGIFVGYQNHRR